MVRDSLRKPFSISLYRKDDADKRVRQLTTLNEITQQLTSTLELEPLLQHIVENAVRILDCEAGSLFLVVEQTQELVLKVAVGPVANVVVGQRLPAGTGIAGQAVQTRQPLIENDLQHSKYFQNNWDQQTGFTSRSLIVVPMQVKDRVIGLIEVINRCDGHAFVADDQSLLCAFAGQAAVAIENARLYSEVQQELSERKKAEQALRNSETIYRQAIEVAGAVPYYQLFFDGGKLIKYEFIGDGIQQITGYGPEEFTATLWDELVEETILVGELSGLSLEEGVILVRSGKRSIWQCEHRIRARDGKIHWVFDAAVDYYDENGISYGSVGMYMDITERKQAEEKVRELNASLEKRVEERTLQLQAEKTKIERFAQDIQCLRALTNLLQACLTIEETGGIISDHMSNLFPGTDGSVFLAREDLPDLLIFTHWGKTSPVDELDPTTCWGIRRSRAHIRRQGGDTSPRCSHYGNNVPKESMCLPLLVQGEAIGLISIEIGWEETNISFTPEMQNLAIASADSIALALANLRLREKLHNQAIRDPLTGLFNRRYLEETLARETHRASRSKSPLCVIMFEVDNFKYFNNTFGHDAGDYVLRRVADTMRANLRCSDYPCRYGGDEFTLLLPDTSLEDGARRAEELRKAVAALTLSFNNQSLGQVTVRMGVAAYPKHGETGEVVRAVADDAAYRARAIGKNCVVVAE